MRRAPFMSIFIIVVLALALCVNVFVFQLSEVVIFRTLPVAKPDDLALLKWNSATALPKGLRAQWVGYEEKASFSYSSFMAMEHAHSIESLFGFAPIDSGPVKIKGDDLNAQGEAVTNDYFAGLGIRAQVGRLIGADTAPPGSPPVVVLSDDFWSREFARDPGIIGQALISRRIAYTIIGVTPVGFSGTESGQSPDFWVPIQQWSETQEMMFHSNIWGMSLIGRLKPQITRKEANAELNGLFQGVLKSELAVSANGESLPHLELASGARGVDLLKQQFSGVTLGLILVSGLVFLISCASVAILMFNRAFARKRDVALQVLLGAPRSSLVAEWFLASFLLAGLGAILGFLLLYWSNSILAAVMVALEPFTGLKIPIAKPGFAAALFTAALTAAAGIISGVIPAWYQGGKEAISALKSQNVHYGKVKVQDFLLACQTSLSVILVIVAGLFTKTLNNLQHQNFGFNPKNIAVFSVNAHKNGYRGQGLAYVYTRLQQRLQEIPAATDVTCSTTTLSSASEFAMALSIPGHPERSQDVPAPFELVGPAFLHTMQIRVVWGRDFTSDDIGGARKVAILSQAMANRYFLGRDAIGQSIVLGGLYAFEVVGVAGDTKGRDLRQESTPRLYIPFSSMLPMLNSSSEGLSYLIRTKTDPGLFAPEIRKVVADIDQHLIIRNFHTQIQEINDAVVPERVLTALVSFFAFLVLLLTLLSVYAIQAHSVVQRTREIGVRLSLGAGRGEIIWLVLRRALYVILPSAALGIAVAMAVNRLFTSQLYGVKPADPAISGFAVLLTTIVGLLGGFVPATRGAHLDPAAALRHE